MGGATISFLNMIMGVKAKGVTPIVVLPLVKNGEELETRLKENDIEYYRKYIIPSRINQDLHFSNCLRWIVKYLYLSFQKKRSEKELSELINQIKPDIIHTNVGSIHEGFKVAQKEKIPHVWHIREYQTKDFNWFIYPSFRKFTQLLKQSYVVTITDDLRNYFGIDSNEKAQTIYNGIFPTNECVFEYEKEPYFLMASRISPEKGHVDVVKAFSEFCKINNNFILKIAGFGNNEYIDELKKIAKDRRCEDKIEFLGYQKDVKSLMKKAQALVVASYNEGFGRMTAEAMFCGTIVIGRETAGTKEILNKTGGFFFNTVEEMISKMEEVSNLNKEEHSKIACEAQQKAVALFSTESNIDKILSLYDDILMHNHNLNR